MHEARTASGVMREAQTASGVMREAAADIVLKVVRNFMHSS